MTPRSLPAAFVLATCAVAQAAPPPFQMNHQGFLLTGNDEPVTNPTLEMTFRIYDVELPVGIQAEFWKAVCVVSVSDGFYSVTLGGETCGNELESSAVPFGEDRFLEIEVDGNRLLPRLRLSAVPNAANAAAFGGLTPDQYWKKSDVLEGSGAGFTDLDASALATGTVPEARLSSNVMLADKEQTVTGLKTFAADGAPFAVTSTTKVARLNADLLDGQDSSDFATKAELSGAGTVNAGANPVDWTKLKNVPAGFADGTDADTKYSNGSGLSLSGTTFSIANSGVTSAMLASNAVTTAKIENGAVTTAKLGSCSGNQVLFKSGSSWACKNTVGIYTTNSHCPNANTLTTASTCKTALCVGAPINWYFNCSGTCVSSTTTSQTCPNTLLGRMIAP